MTQDGHICLSGLADLIPQSHPGMFVRKDNYDVQASIITEGYQFVPKYEIYNLGNGLSYVKPVA